MSVVTKTTAQINTLLDKVDPTEAAVAALDTRLDTLDGRVGTQTDNAVIAGVSTEQATVSAAQLKLASQTWGVNSVEGMDTLPAPDEFSSGIVVANDMVVLSNQKNYITVPDKFIQRSQALSVYRKYHPTPGDQIKFCTVGTSGRDFTSVQTALDNQYKLIFVDAGVYFEKVLIYNTHVSLVCLNGFAIFDGVNYPVDAALGFHDSKAMVCVGSGSHHCYFENIIARNGPGNGFKDGNTVTGRGGNVFYNCHAYDNFVSGFLLSSEKNIVYGCTGLYNYDYEGIGSDQQGENSDGFGISGANCVENELYYCYAEGNADDGFDVFNARRTLLHGCGAYYNGYPVGNRNRSFTPVGVFSGDGNGLKLGGHVDARTNQATIAKYCYAHTNRHGGIMTNNGEEIKVEFCIAVHNHLEAISSETVGLRNFWIDDNKNNSIKNCVAPYQSVTVGTTLTVNAYNSWQLIGVSGAPTLALADFEFTPGKIGLKKITRDNWFKSVIGDFDILPPYISICTAITDKFETA